MVWRRWSKAAELGVADARAGSSRARSAQPHQEEQQAGGAMVGRRARHAAWRRGGLGLGLAVRCATGGG
jgi:hypothetical protein